MLQVRLALFGAKHWKQILVTIALVFSLFFMLFFAAQEEQGLDGQPLSNYWDVNATANVSPLVMRYEPLVRKYAQQYGVESYVQLLLAKMMQESGGRVPDVMQSSESLGLPPNTIQDPEYSIQVGVRYFAGILKNAGGDVLLALQSYNFGGGFIPFALERGGYSKPVAVEFSTMMAAKLGWARYGDVNYVDNVLRYLLFPTVSGGNTFNAVMEVALQYQGMPYQWGGASPSTSFDCSGLWMWSFRQIGINIPRTAAEQYNYTQRISINQLQPGDFIFFTGTSDHNYISHVGIYVGNGKMYNSNSKGVGYSDLAGYWDKHTVGYGRLTGVN